jgi:UDP-GlcNAc:undecaprenyl-phosphate GlcNAc-1-phosphate transferase
VREYLLTLFVAAAVTYLLTGVVRYCATRAGAMAAVRDRDVHAIPTPRLGGVAMFGGLCAALLVASNLPFMRTVYQQSNDPAALLSGAALVCVLGVIDDRWGMDPFLKLAGQIIAAGVMVIQGIQMGWLPTHDGTLGLAPTHLDGLAAGVVAIGALAFFGYSYWLWVRHGAERAASPTLFTAVLAGMCLGFLPHNFHPARIFMGDSGSMLIGLLLAASSISILGRVDSAANDRQGLVPALLPLVLPLTVVAVPLVDLALAVVRRTRAGRSPFAADKEHLHHRLLEIGHSHRRAVLIMYFWSALIAFGAVLIGVVDGRAPIISATVCLVLLGLLLLVLPRLRAVPPERSTGPRAPYGQAPGRDPAPVAGGEEVPVGGARSGAAASGTSSTSRTSGTSGTDPPGVRPPGR